MFIPGSVGWGRGDLIVVGCTGDRTEAENNPFSRFSSHHAGKNGPFTVSFKVEFMSVIWALLQSHFQSKLHIENGQN